MDAKKNRGWIEGVVITLIGLVCLYLALTIPNNPVKRAEGFVGFMAEAKLFPLIASCVITILGIVMTGSDLVKNRKAPPFSKGELVRTLFLLAATVIYVVLIHKIGFLISTFLYLGATLFYYNYKERKWYVILALTAAFTVIGAYLVPLAINLRLP